jgi:hypothetical protein
MTTRDVKQSAGRRLAELRRGYPTDATLENLLTILRAELDLCAKLPLYAYEATTEGHEDCASLLETHADTERAHVEQILATLRDLLAQRGSRTEASG